MNFVRGMPVEQIILEYESGKTLGEIAKENNVSISKLKSILMDEGGLKGKEIMQKELNQKYKITLPIEDIVEDYKKRKDCKKIAEDYNVSEWVIYSRIKDYELLTGENVLRSYNKEQYRDDVPEDIIGEEYRKGNTTYPKLAKKYNVAASTIKRRIDSYEIKNPRKENRNDIQKKTEDDVTDKFNKKMKENGSEKAKRKTNMPLSMIYNYLKYGYDLKKIEQYAQELGYTIDKKDIETFQKMQKGELKVVTEASIEKIIEKYGYSYEELAQIAEKKGYVVFEDRYISAKANINNKNKEGEEK